MSASEKLFETSRRIFPGGVNSPVRYYDPFPIFIKSGSGAKIRDEDDREYIDYCLGFGPHILGHSHPSIVNSITKQVKDIISPGTVNRAEQELGSAILDAVKEDQIRFTNSGTEATMHVIRLARGYNKRKIIIKMEGGYHGSHDYSLIKSGSGNLTFGVPSSDGIPEEVSSTVIPVSFNDLPQIEEIFKLKGKEIAAVIAEPVMGNAGVILPEDGFLMGLRNLCDKYGALLIFDEVITGFRFHYGSYQQLAGVKADLTTYGKIIGGGMPIGAITGPSEIMRNFSPSGKVYEAGTFAGNPVSMKAGTAALEVLRSEDYSRIDLLTDTLLTSLLNALENAGIKATGNRIGSMFQFFLTNRKVRSYSEATMSDAPLYMDIFREALSNGVFLAPGQYETNFVSFSHTPDIIRETVERMVKSIDKVSEDRRKRK